MRHQERKWLGAWGASLLVHAGAFGIAALIGLVMRPSGAGCGLLTVEIGGPGGLAGGFGELQHEGRKGDGGANASGAQTSAPGESDGRPPQRAAPKADDGLAMPEPNLTAAAAAHRAPADLPQAEAVEEARPMPMPEPAPAPAPDPAATAEAEAEASPPRRQAADPERTHAAPDDAELPPEKEAEAATQKALSNLPPALQGKKEPQAIAQAKRSPDAKASSEKHRNKERTAGSGLGKDDGSQAKKSTEGDRDGKSAQQIGGAAGAAGSSGSAFSQGTDDGSGLGKGRGDLAGDGAFRDNGDGTFSARGAGGFQYRILYEEPARYPKQARSLGYGKSVSVRVRFLVGESGRVEKTVVLTKHLPKLGFEEAALRSIGKLEFEPIRLHGKPISVWFVKTFHFSPG